jgi:alpha-galactosidase
MERKYNIMSYRQDLTGYGEPMEGMWDGFQRINTESKNGGIIGVFRHGSLETRRIVSVNYLDPEKTYMVKTISGNVVCTLTGKDLCYKGFAVDLEGVYSGELYEISVNQ